MPISAPIIIVSLLEFAAIIIYLPTWSKSVGVDLSTVIFNASNLPFFGAIIILSIRMKYFGD